MCGLDSPLYRFGLCLNKMFDSMASGKPGICALNVKSYFSEYKCGYDLSIKDIDRICETIKEIKVMNSDELNKIEQSGKMAIKLRFNYKKLAENFMRLMEGIVNEG